MVRDTHPEYDLYQLFSEPFDFGYQGVARFRTWVIGLQDPFELLDDIKNAFVDQKCTTSVSDYLVASRPEILLEASDLAERRGIFFRPNTTKLDYLLTSREAEVVANLNARFQMKYRQAPWERKDLVFSLVDNANYGSSWSAGSGKIPTYRCNAKTGIYWLPGERRFMTSKERLISMGWPCVPEVSDHLQAPLVGASDRHRASQLVGNAMHWSTCGILQLIALSCFGPSCPDPDDDIQII